MADEAAAKLAELSMGGAAPEPATPSRHEEPAGAPGADQAGPAASTDGAKTPSSRADSASRAVHDMRKLFVGGLPQGSTEEAISAVFGPFGEVEEVRATCLTLACMMEEALTRAPCPPALPLGAQVHMIKPNPSSDSKRGCCFVTYVSAAAAEEAMRALNGHICEPLGTTMPLLVRVADPPRSREEQRSRVAAQQAQQRMPAQVGVLPAWAGALGYGWPAQQPAAFAGAQAGQPFFLAQAGASGSQPTSPQYMGVFPGGYGFGMVPQFPPTQQGEWSEHADTEGNKYYYNSQSGVSQWEPPAHWPTSQAQQLPMMYPYAQALPAGCAPRRAHASSAAAVLVGIARAKLRAGASLSILPACLPASLS